MSQKPSGCATPIGPTVNRRAVVGGGLALAGVTLLGVPASASDSKKTSSIKIGDFKVTTFSDGHLMLPADMFAPRADAAARTTALASAGQTGNMIRSPLNVTLIERGEEKILVDVGSGDRFMATAGKLLAQLGAAGVEREQITKVVFTHAHPDHIWGTLDEFDELAFPNAAYSIAEVEWNFWQGPNALQQVPADRQAFVVGAQRNLNAVKDRISMLKPGAEIVSGLQAVDTSGHTPGHISLEIAAGGETLMILGDALAHPVISFQHPEWQPAVDQEPDKAVATRKRLLDKLAHEKTRIIGYHLPDPGTGRVVRKGTSFTYQALA